MCIHLKFENDGKLNANADSNYQVTANWQGYGSHRNAAQMLGIPHTQIPLGITHTHCMPSQKGF